MGMKAPRGLPAVLRSAFPDSITVARSALGPMRHRSIGYIALSQSVRFSWVVDLDATES